LQAHLSALEQKPGDLLLELGLLLIVTGMLVGVFLMALALTLGSESYIASSSLVEVCSAAALSGLFALVFILLRRAKRLLAFL